jgi:hypothetical protein
LLIYIYNINKGELRVNNLFDAIAENNKKAIFDYILGGGYLEITNDLGFTLLEYANICDAEAIKWLLIHGGAKFKWINIKNGKIIYEEATINDCGFPICSNCYFDEELAVEQCVECKQESINEMREQLC